MANNSSIEWTEKTWNPVTGCNKVSLGCQNCYAERMAWRLKGMGNPRYKEGFSVALHEDRLSEPKRWKKPRLVFINSMSDLFHNEVPVAFINKTLSTVCKTPWHTYQVLTKRSERLRELGPILDWPRNLWVGVTVENNDCQYRIKDLKILPAALRFLSIEPLLSRIPNLQLKGIQWVIVGGESGPGARPMHVEWVRETKW